jgi:hypothetical protein
MLNGTELGHLDKHREGGFGPDAGDAGDVEANFCRRASITLRLVATPYGARLS